jgi:hypothetical protein
MHPWWNQIEELAAGVRSLARIRTGELASVTVAVPVGVPADEVARILRDRLGAPGLEVRTREGPLRVVSAEFKRG